METAAAHAFTDPAMAMTFTLAGNATLTLESERTGAHLTYRVSKPKPRAGAPEGTPVWFVKAREGARYAYLGKIDGRRRYWHGDRSPILAGSPADLAFRFYWSHVTAGTMPAKLVVRHMGTCGRCGRALTVPDSIEAGIGPECAKKGAVQT